MSGWWYAALVTAEVIGIVALDRSYEIGRMLDRRQARRDWPRAIARWSRW